MKAQFSNVFVRVVTVLMVFSQHYTATRQQYSRVKMDPDFVGFLAF